MAPKAEAHAFLAPSNPTSNENQNSEINMKKYPMSRDRKGDKEEGGRERGKERRKGGMEGGREEKRKDGQTSIKITAMD